MDEFLNKLDRLPNGKRTQTLKMNLVSPVSRTISYSLNAVENGNRPALYCRYSKATLKTTCKICF